MGELLNILGRNDEDSAEVVRQVDLEVEELEL
jgi:hypothetical protein